MDSENDLCAELLPFAVNVAKQYTRDHNEAESIAGWALLRAVRSYNWFKCPDGIKGYVAHCVKMDVFHWQRKVKVRSVVKATEWIANIAKCEDRYIEDPLTEFEWWLLIVKVELKWPYDVVARRSGISVRQVRKLLAEAAAKLEAVL